MKFKSPVQCEAIVEQRRVDQPISREQCLKGAEFKYGGQCYCRTHFSQLVTNDYIASTPECLLMLDIQIGGTKYRLSPDKFEALRRLLEPSREEA